MKKRRFALIVPALACLGLLPLDIPLSAQERASKGVTVTHPWVRATPGGSTISSAYMEINAAAGTADKLVAASSPAAGRVEVHTHIKEGDIMKMRRVEVLEIKPGETRILKPSGDHIMMFDLKAPLKEGDVVKLVLSFEKAGSVEVEATVKPIGATGPHGMDHQPGSEGQNAGNGGGHQHH